MAFWVVGAFIFHSNFFIMVMSIPKSPAYKYILKTLAGKIPKLGETAEQSDPTAWIKLFTPDSNWTWHIVEYDPEDDVCYGLVHGVETEFGSFSLAELREIRGALGLPVERDIHFTPRPISECQRT